MSRNNKKSSTPLPETNSSPLFSFFVGVFAFYIFLPSQIPPVPKANRFCGSVFVINSVCNFGNEASRQTLQAQSGLRFPKMFRQGQKLYLVSEHLLIEK